MRGDEIPLIDIHSALSHLHYAVTQELKDVPCRVRIEWNPYTFLTVKVDWLSPKDRDVVVARLQHGVLNGPYDYRFSMTSHGCGKDGNEEWVEAQPNMMHKPKRKAA